MFLSDNINHSIIKKLLQKKMSHLSTIRTKIKDKDALLEALQVLNYEVEVDKTMVNPANHQHEELNVHVSAGKDIGFRLNPTTETYELVTDLQTWNQPIPVERFLDKLSQQYARTILHAAVKEEGFQIAEEWEMDDNSIELTVTRWD